MKKIFFLFAFIAILGSKSVGQSLKTLYFEEKYDEGLTRLKDSSLFNAEDCFYMARLLVKKAKYESSLSFFNLSAAKGNESAELLYYKSTPLWYLERFDEAVIDLQKAKKLDPNNPKYGDALGYGYYLNNDYEKALTEYRLVQQFNNPPASSFYMEGQVYVRQGKYQEALQVFESKLAQIKGDDEYYFDAMMAIGNIYFYHIKNYSKAIETCVDLSLLYPDNEDVLISLMKAYNAFGKYSEANDVFKQLKTAFQSKKILPHLQKTKSVAVADYFWGKKSIVIKRKFVEPENVGDPYFIAVLYDEEGTLERVFLAEKTLTLTEKSVAYLLCENIKGGGHRNFGFGFKNKDIGVKEMYEAVVLVLEKNVAPANESQRK